MKHEELMKLAVALAVRENKGIAVLAKPDAGITKVGVHNGVIPHSAAAAVLHREREDLNGYSLYLSYKPTEICLGLAWRAKVDAVYFMDQLAMVKVDPTKPDNSVFGYPTSRAMSSGVDILRTDTRIRSQFLTAAKAKLPASFLFGRPLDPNSAGRLAIGLANRKAVLAQTPIETDEIFMRLVFSLVRWGWNDNVARDSRAGPSAPRPFGNNIGGILVNAHNQILAWGLNMKSVNPTFHAETMMILAWLGRNGRDRLPDGCRVYTSLQCCNMCAAHIATLGKGVRVYYGQTDTNIAPTALSRRVNGCSESPSMTAQRAWLDVMQAQVYSPTETIDFLFNNVSPTSGNRPTMSSQHAFEHGSHLQPLRFPVEAADKSPGEILALVKDHQPPAAIAREAQAFLQDLAKAGIIVGHR